MKKMILLGALGATVLGGGFAVAQTAKPDRDADWKRTDLIARLDAQFAKLDTNGDGKITAEERQARKDARVEQAFARMDADKNGAITLEEMKAAHANRGEGRMKRGEGKPGEPGMHHGRRGHGKGMGRGPGMGMRGGHDANKDGIVTKEEFRAGALARFDRMDTDKNGVVTKAERDAAREAWKQQRSSR